MGKERNNYQIGIYLEKALNEKNMSIKQLGLTDTLVTC